MPELTVGMDLSLSGAAAVAWDGSEVYDSILVRTKSSLCLEERSDIIARKILSFWKRMEPDLVLLESGARGGKFVDLNVYHMVGVVRWKLWRRQAPVALCSPTHLKKVATGNGRADKQKMVEAAQPYWPGLKNDNLADALHLARLGFEEYDELVVYGVA